MSGVVVALLLGLRHGIDPDHIAAISDIAAMRPSIRDTIRRSFLYAIGHAVVVLAFVLIATALGASMPAWFGTVSSWLVGTTLIALGVWVLIGLIVGDDRPRSRYGFVRILVGRLSWRRAEAVAFEHEHPYQGRHHLHVSVPAGSNLSPSGEAVGTTHRHVGLLPGTPAPFLVGMAHGFGAETPTQIALLAAATGTSALVATSLGVAFVTGLVVSNMGVAVVASLGAAGSRYSRVLSKTLTVVAGVASIYVGLGALAG